MERKTTEAQSTENIIEIRNLVRQFEDDGTIAVDHISLNIRKGEFVTFLGPSGCGKTTTLRMIAGFEKPTEGEILLAGKEIGNLPPHKRPINTVFQRYALFPHLNVFENVAFGLKLKRIKVTYEDGNGRRFDRVEKLSKREIAEKVERALKIVDLEGFEKRSVSTLSGGQQQRVAIARAIVIKPDVLLMDEPLSNLDAKLRIEMRNAIRQIQNSVGITTIYVTHDQEEAMAVSDRIAVMSGGVIQHVSTPKSIYQRPANQFVANFIGRSNTLKARYAQGALHFDNGYAMPYDNCGSVPAEDVLVAVRPEEFVLAADGQQGIDATVTSSVFLGLNTTYFVELYDGTNAEIVEESSISSIIPNGTKVKLTLKQDKINVFTADGKTNLTKGVVNDVR